MTEAVVADLGTLRDADRQRRRKTKQLQFVLGIGFPICLLVVWEILTRTGIADRRFFPAPTTIGTVMVQLLESPMERARIGADIVATFRRLIIGYGLGAFAGITLGLAMGLSAKIRYSVAPMITATFPTPKLALFPFLIVLFGLGDASKIAILVLGVFYMTCLSTLTGVTYSNPMYRDVAQAFRIPRMVYWTRVVIPAALPSIVTGLKLGVGQALILIVAVEMIASQEGIGHFIWNSWEIFDVPRMFMGLIIAILMGGGAMLFGEFLERKLTPWVVR